MTNILTPHFNVGTGWHTQKQNAGGMVHIRYCPNPSFRLLKDIRLLKIDIKRF